HTVIRCAGVARRRAPWALRKTTARPAARSRRRSAETVDRRTAASGPACGGVGPSRVRSSWRRGEGEVNQDRRQVRVRYRRGRGREGISPVPSLRQGSGPPLRAATGAAPRPLRRTPAPDSSPGPAPRPPAASAHEAGAPRLSLPIDRVRVHYDVVVVGSGYGGAIAASRFARAGRSVCVLERGREIRTGQFPDTAWRALRELQLRSRGRRRLGSPSALFDLHTGYDLSV